jgi:hypothetical protein
VLQSAQRVTPTLRRAFLEWLVKWRMAVERRHVGAEKTAREERGYEA